MIPVKEQPEPVDFSRKVKNRGTAFLQKVAHPTEWKNREYWRDALHDLYQAYAGICAYSAHWIQPDQGAATVDHFIPKSVNHQLAYDWHNYRLASRTMNIRKGNHQDVLDPFRLKPNWFIMDFPSLLIKPNSILTTAQKEKVSKTITRLKLNADEICVRSRKDWLLPFCKKEYSFDFLQMHAPFIAYELQRQNLIDKIVSIMIP